MNGLLEVVHIGTYAHDAWADFYRGNKIYHFIPDTMTTFADWPPTDYPSLNLFSRRLEELRCKWDKSDVEDHVKRAAHALPDDVIPYNVPRPRHPMAYIPIEKKARESA